MPITVTRPADQTVDADLQKAVDMRLGMESRQGQRREGVLTQKPGPLWAVRAYVVGKGYFRPYQEMPSMFQPADFRRLHSVMLSV